MVAILAFFLLKTRPQKPAGSPKPVPEDEAPQIRKLDSVDEKKIVQEQKVARQRAVFDVKERNLDLKRLPLKIVDQESVLFVELVMKPSCRPGDADAIQMDLKAAPDHKLMVTLEPLTRKTEALQWDVPSDFFTQGIVEKEFRIPVSEQPSLWGFFLCTAQSRDATCRDKAVTDINNIFTEHLNKKPKAGQQLRSIFYQVFLLDDWGVAAFADIPKTSKRFEQFEKYSVERGISSKESSRAFDLTQKNTETLLSLPFYFNGKTLRVELPKYKIDACANRK